MSIKIEVSPVWSEMLDVFSEEQRALLLDEAEYLADRIQRRNPTAYISTNRALELMFKTALVMGELEERKGNHER